MIKFEMHTHLKGSSKCAFCDIKTLIDEYKTEGYGGVMITNHYDVYNFYNHLPAGTFKDKNDFFFSIIEEAKEYGKSQGIKVFWGAEIRTGFGVEFMVIGLDKQAFYNRSKPLFSYSPKMLFELANGQGAFMYQTHPFRENVACGKAEFMHGAEIFNGHFHHQNNNDKAKEFVEKNNLVKMAGSDYHEQGQPITTCMYLPEEITCEKELAQYLLSGKAEYFCNEEKYFTEYKNYMEKKKCK